VNGYAAAGALILCAVPWAWWRGLATGSGFWFFLAPAVTGLGCVLLNIGLGGASLPGVG
jgi:hypothetical protein